MDNIRVGRYSHPKTREFWQGWIEPDDRGWIMFVAADGSPVVFLDRDPETGAVLSDRISDDVRCYPNKASEQSDVAHIVGHTCDEG